MVTILCLALRTSRIVKELSIFVLKLGQVRSKDILSLMEVLALEEGTTTVRAIILVTDYASL